MLSYKFRSIYFLIRTTFLKKDFRSNYPMNDSFRTLFNILIVLVTPLPSVWAGYYLNNVDCDPESICQYTKYNALISINILLLINFDLGFTILN